MLLDRLNYLCLHLLVVDDSFIISSLTESIIWLVLAVSGITPTITSHFLKNSSLLSKEKHLEKPSILLPSVFTPQSSTSKASSLFEAALEIVPVPKNLFSYLPVPTKKDPYSIYASPVF